MADEQTTVSTETTTDVSTETNTQATTDNSGVSTEEIGKILDETENPEPEKPAESKIEDPQKTEQETQDNTIECPDKFKNKDGSANLEKILKLRFPQGFTSTVYNGNINQLLLDAEGD